MLKTLSGVTELFIVLYWSAVFVRVVLLTRVTRLPHSLPYFYDKSFGSHKLSSCISFLSTY